MLTTSVQIKIQQELQLNALLANAFVASVVKASANSHPIQLDSRKVFSLVLPRNRKQYKRVSILARSSWHSAASKSKVEFAYWNRKSSDQSQKITEKLVLEKLGSEQLKKEYADYIQYKRQYNKLTEGVDFEYRRFMTYQKNVRKINDHNERYERGEKTYKIGINKFTDWVISHFAA
ncbi:unnamed protein product [Thelazia callipaeda]|uniref:Inhibitor_I29 domain-containing protein n=1 Tax=Thelazia callipaeda TaxID=103827 RepID=A0A0N5D225_THECL|nr:unnamed protein product [Thelazia callipaeda]